jgi:hypothetical protein
LDVARKWMKRRLGMAGEIVEKKALLLQRCWEMRERMVGGGV